MPGSTVTWVIENAELTALGARARLEDVAPDLADLVSSYRAGYLAEDRRELEEALADAGKRSGEIEARRDILAYQIKALAELANDQADWGWQQMGEEQSRLAHASSLIELTQGTVDTLGEGDEPILSVLGRLQHRLQEGAALDARLQEPTDLLAAASNELSEALTLLRRHLDRFEVDPVRLAERDMPLMQSAHRGNQADL